ncbi:hypothetical protein RB614_28335 [Phytohabitans sp. ZYX-F-186]|uniref:Uncharacterized protein n=1 Tax=Phytohabitans maris TaxID=3071409 RepID=A0ABU0ZN29_9ACTN|nr:hypothetical protein [Phytohabitans sp. ZYX-F-186]MDQ7908443.1 hypothetical protein [Phytohabitans sp. ZYX-F-186]
MSRDEVDRAIVGLVAAYDRISAAMFEMDAHPALVLLRGSSLRGRTAEVATEVLAAVEVLWSQFAALGAQLDRAKTVRAERSRPGDAELRVLTSVLRHPIVGLSASGLVVDSPAAGGPASWQTVPGLADDLETVAAEVVRALGEVEAASGRVAALYAQPTAALEKASADATNLGGDALKESDVDGLAASLANAQAEALRDPIGASGPPPELVSEIDALARRIAGLAALRTAYPERVRSLTTAVDEVAAAEAAAAKVYALALEKIANAGLPPAPDAVGGLRAHLAQLGQLHREGRWARLADELSIVERSVARAKERAAHLHEAADGLLQRRTELRGRLDAYRARAGRMGLVEHEELAARHRAAQDLLYTSPCDLPAATRAVVAYQRYLNQLTERGNP